MTQIKFNKNLYTKKALEKTIKAYKKIGKFKLKSDSKYFQVKIITVSDKFKAEPVAEEFSNYALAESISK